MFDQRLWISREHWKGSQNEVGASSRVSTYFHLCWYCYLNYYYYRYNYFYYYSMRPPRFPPIIYGTEAHLHYSDELSNNKKHRTCSFSIIIDCNSMYIYIKYSTVSRRSKEMVYRALYTGFRSQHIQVNIWTLADGERLGATLGCLHTPPPTKKLLAPRVLLLSKQSKGYPLQHFVHWASAHSNSNLTFLYNIYRHAGFCLQCRAVWIVSTM